MVIDKRFLLAELFGLWDDESKIPEFADDILNKALDFLSERERLAIVYRFAAQRLTYTQIGEELGVTRERARQILVKAMRKLRHPLRLGHVVRPCNLDDIQNLGVSVRTMNGLRRMGVNTISSLVLLKPSDILKGRKMGKVALYDVERALANLRKGLS